MKPYDLVMIYITNEEQKYHCLCNNIDQKCFPSLFQADISLIILNIYLSSLLNDTET